jgi:outer membrane receptor protein involved in Fe transport
VQGDYQYVGSMDQGGFSDLKRPSYGSFDLRLGIGLTDRTQLTLFANNVLDERGVLSNYLIPEDGIGGAIPAQFLRESVVVRPRTVGVKFRYRQ